MDKTKTENVLNRPEGEYPEVCPECGEHDYSMKVSRRQLLLYSDFECGVNVSLDDLVRPGEGNTVRCDICDYDGIAFEDLFLERLDRLSELERRAAWEDGWTRKQVLLAMQRDEENLLAKREQEEYGCGF